MKNKRRNISTVNTILVILLVLIIMFPFYIMLVGAFKPNPSLISVPIDLNPFRNLTMKNISKVLEKSDIFRWLLNSFIISIGVSILTVIIALTAGYAFSRLDFPGKNILFALVMATLMMPKQVLLIPNFLVANSLGLVNKLIGVILTTIAPAFGIFLCRQFVGSLPKELFDAAEIDGCGEFGKFIKIAVPLSLPSMGTVLIFSFFNTFNDYLWQLVMISDKKNMTLPIGVTLFSQLNASNKALQLAVALMATIPLAVLFIALQKFFIKGATAGAVKG